MTPNHQEALGQYLRIVRAQIQANLSYPEAARRLRLVGTVLVRLHIKADGSLDRGSITMTGSSGVAVLDGGAVETVVRAAPFPPPPAGAITVEVPVAFHLR